MRMNIALHSFLWPNNILDKGSDFFTPLSTLVIACLFNFTDLSECGVHLIVVLVCIPPKAKDDEHLFMCLLASRNKF